MKKILFVTVIAIIALFSACVDESGDSDNDSKNKDSSKTENTVGLLTITGINAENFNYNNHYAYALGNIDKDNKLGAYMDFKTKEKGRINQNGEVTLSVWKLKDDIGKNYNGNDHVIFSVWIYYSGGTTFVTTGTVEVTFTNGTGSGTFIHSF